MIREQCGCGASIQFEKPRRHTYADQDAAANEYLSKFRAEHQCREPENVEEPT